MRRSQAGHFLGISNLAGTGAGAIGAYIGGPIAAVASVKEKPPRLASLSALPDPGTEAPGVAA